MTFAERDELAMELWKEGENHVLRRDWPGAQKTRRLMQWYVAGSAGCRIPRKRRSS